MKTEARYPIRSEEDYHEFGLEFCGSQMRLFRRRYFRSNAKHKARIFTKLFWPAGCPQQWIMRYLVFEVNGKRLELMPITPEAYDTLTRGKDKESYPEATFCTLEIFDPNNNQLMAKTTKKKVEEQASEITAAPLQMLPQLLSLEHIIPDPNQPRKHFNQEELDELTASVKKHGVLQPIIVRPFKGVPDSYMIVFGERRFRAACMADLKVIPATVRELTDEEAFELQIVENLQRQDVHPMEEAKAFRYLYDHGKAVEDIAGKVGKGVKYVAARLKLTDLIPEFQEAYLAGMMEYKDAKLICKANEEVQRLIFNEAARYEGQDNSFNGFFNDDDEEDEDAFVTPDEYDTPEEDLQPDEPQSDEPKKLVSLQLWNVQTRLTQNENNLDSASFDTEDPELHPEMGACANCKYNSANTPSLFIESSRICNNAVCFTAKAKRMFQRLLEEHATNPNMLFIYDGYGKPYGREMDDVKAAEELGLKVLTRNDYSTDGKDAPDPLETFDEWYKDAYDDDGPRDEERAEIQEEYNEYVEWWNKQQSEYESWSKGEGLYDAFIVSGNSRSKGRIVKVRLKASSEAIEGIPDGTTANVQAQIANIKDRQKRSKELDGEKVHALVKKAFKECEDYKESEGDLLRSELIGLCIFLYDTVGYDQRDYLAKALGFERFDYQMKDMFDFLQTVPYDRLSAISHRMIRALLIQRLTSDNDNPLKSGKAAALRQMALDYIKEDVSRFDLEQEEKAIKREKNAEKKIEQLLKQSQAATDEVGA